jgi:uncharacterized protein (DUF4213/DUF364 family)
MKLISDLINSLNKDAPVKRIIVGAHWTAIQSYSCGMASTTLSDKPHGEGSIKNAGILHQMSAKTLACYAQSDNALEASIGLASINSLIKIPTKDLISANAFDMIAEKGRNKNIAIFGHFPKIEQLRTTAQSVRVFELTPGEDELGLEKIPEILPNAEVVAITANTIINHTLDMILAHLKSGCFAIMVGPSTPLSPVLFDYGFSMLAGIKVVDPELIFQFISQGAIFRQVKGVDMVAILK